MITLQLSLLKSQQDGEGMELVEESEIFALYRLAQVSYITSLNLSVFLV